MRTTTLLLALMLVPTVSHAKTVFCKIENSDIGPTSVTWDDSTKVAKIAYLVDGTLIGRVTLISTSGSGNEAVNLSFTEIPKKWKNDEWEFLVHQPFEGEYVIMGVGYAIVDGIKYMSSTRGIYSAKCDSL